jgi:hypothetical protein
MAYQEHWWLKASGHGWILKVFKSNRAPTMTAHTATQNTSLDNLIQLLLNEGYVNGSAFGLRAKRHGF